jgi:hypothetical protein
MKRDVVVLWFMSGTVVFLPIYFNGTRSVLLKLCGVTLTHENGQWFSIAACAILLPVAYGWKAGRRVGAIVQFGLLGSIVFWLAAFEQRVLQNLLAKLRWQAHARMCCHGWLGLIDVVGT